LTYIGASANLGRSGKDFNAAVHPGAAP